MTLGSCVLRLRSAYGGGQRRAMVAGCGGAQDGQFSLASAWSASA